MKSIEEAEIKEGTRVFVRVDWNVPISKSSGENGQDSLQILDSTRIKSCLETVKYIKNLGGRPILASHFGRSGDSIAPIIEFAKNNFSKLSEGVEFLENLRKNEGEESNSREFAEELSKKADIYVNEAFSVSHRKHTSIVGVPKILTAFAGFDFLNEYRNLSRAFQPEHPFFLILGGAKFETKLPLVKKFLEIADNIFIGGALAAKASQFPDSPEDLDAVYSPKIIFPVGDYEALDANTETLEVLAEKIREAKFILWNGPLGNYEKNFVAGTVALARLLAESSAEVIVGGGDTLAAVGEETKKQIASHGFISTSGGAMLDFLASGTLPGIEALS